MRSIEGKPYRMTSEFGALLEFDDSSSFSWEKNVKASDYCFVRFLDIDPEDTQYYFLKKSHWDQTQSLKYEHDLPRNFRTILPKDFENAGDGNYIYVGDENPEQIVELLVEAGFHQLPDEQA